MRLAVLVTFASVAVLAAGCAQLLDAKTAPTVNESPLVVAARTSAEVLKYGDAIDIHLTVTNMSADVWEQRFPDGCHYGYAIYDRWGERVVEYPGTCTRAMSFVDFGSGQTVKKAMSWAWQDTTMRPGYYFLSAGLGSGARLLAADDIVIELR